MSTDFKRGMVIGLLIYGVGAAVMIIVHLIYGWDNPHSPPSSIFPIMITLAVGAIRLMITAIQTLFGKSIQAKGELIVHLAVVFVIVLFVFVVKYMNGS